MATSNKDPEQWVECLSLQNQIKKALKSKNDPFDKEIEEMRQKLRNNYLYLLDNHIEFSFSKDVLVNLWKFVFYKKIEFSRKKLRTCRDSDVISNLTVKIIPDAMAVYNNLLNKHLAKAMISEELLDLCKSNDNVSTNTIMCSVKIAHKCLIFIGDLERYRQTYLERNFKTAQSYYSKALKLYPICGNPHNQLAVLSQNKKDDFHAIYNYSLSLFVEKPFMTSKENIAILFKKNIALLKQFDDDIDDFISKIKQCADWDSLQIYVIYVLGIVYLRNICESAKYANILFSIRDVVLNQIMKVLLLSPNQDKNEEKSNIDRKEKDVTMKQLCVISIFIVHECFDSQSDELDAYKQSISWALSLIAGMMQSLTLARLSLLSPICICCSWLRNHFDFAVPDMTRPPWNAMQIDQNDLSANNQFFSQFANLLNLLYDSFSNQSNGSMRAFDDDCLNNLILPEQIEFYGIEALRSDYLNHLKFNPSNNNDCDLFIFLRRFCNKKIKIKKNQENFEKSLNYKRYSDLLEFAQFATKKIEGVLIFNDQCLWTANKLLTIEEPANEVIESNSSHSPIDRIHNHAHMQRPMSTRETTYHSPLLQSSYLGHQIDQNQAIYHNHSHPRHVFSHSAPCSPRGNQSISKNNNHFVFGQPLFEDTVDTYGGMHDSFGLDTSKSADPTSHLSQTMTAPTTPHHQYHTNIQPMHSHSPQQQTSHYDYSHTNTYYSHQKPPLRPYHTIDSAFQFNYPPKSSHGLSHSQQPVTQPTTPTFISRPGQHHYHQYPPHAHHPPHSPNNINDMDMNMLVTEVFNDLHLTQQ